MFLSSRGKEIEAGDAEGSATARPRKRRHPLEGYPFQTKKGRKLGKGG